MRAAQRVNGDVGWGVVNQAHVGVVEDAAGPAVEHAKFLLCKPLEDDRVDHRLERVAGMVKGAVDPSLFKGLAEQEFGVLYGWYRCGCDNGDVRLMHDTVTRVAINALSRKELNAARTDGASTQKRLVRLAETLAGMAPAIAMDPAQVR